MDKRPVICHLTSVHTVYDTRIFLKECISLARHYQVYLVAPHDKKEQKEGVHIIPLKQYRSRIARMLLCPWQVFFKALKVKADIYHFHDPELIWVGLLLRLSGKKVIYDIHENVKADLREKDWLPLKSLFIFLYGLLESMACRYFYLVLANQAYVPYFEKKKADYTLIRNFVPLKLFEPLRKPYNTNSDTLLFVGMLSARRGLPWLLDALQLLKQKGIIINLLCIGYITAGVKGILNRSASYPDIKEQVSLAGYMPMQEAYAHAAECFAGVALLENIENNRYNYPTKLFEYMAAGLPVICSDFLVNREVVEDCKCGYCVDPQKAEEIADAIAYIYQNRQEAADMSANGIRSAGRYSWEHEEQALFHLYERILH